MVTSAFIDRLQVIHKELETSPIPEKDLEEFAALALNIGRVATRAIFAEMIDASRSGKSDLEIVGAVPLAVGFVINFVLNASGCDGNSAVADHLSEKIRQVTRELGDGAYKSAPATFTSCH